MKTDIENIIKNIREQFSIDINGANSVFDVNIIKSHYLNKKGIIYQQLLQNISKFSNDKKKEIGLLSNKLKGSLESKISFKIEELQIQDFDKQNLLDQQNPTILKEMLNRGALHPLNLTTKKIITFFQNMNFSIYDFLEIDSEEYNFDKLNIKKDHISRNNNDTFFLKNGNILRTHATNFTSYFLKNIYHTNKNNKVISLGNVYRRDTHDSTHSHQFMQVDGFCIGDYTLANLKSILHEFVNYIFERDIEIKFRPSFFPFTSPSIELDVLCFQCNGNGCFLCKNMGWIEILGAGIIHENVLEMANIDSTKISGFAFGVGIERLAMIKYKINDIRDLYGNNTKFLSQFIGK